jgi:hypothetical protein
MHTLLVVLAHEWSLFLLICTHTHFVALAQHCVLLYRRLLHRLMAEAVTVAEGTSSSSSSGITGDSSSQRLLQAQRQFHTDIKRYQPLFAQVTWQQSLL